MDNKKSDNPNSETTNTDQAFKKLENMISNLGRSISTHPGFMWTEWGFEVLHAEWPAYPWGHGEVPSLNSLAEFPKDTKFYPIDHIDQCTLFVVGKNPNKDVFSEDNFHVAIWDEDLFRCANKLYIEGIQGEFSYPSYPNGYIELTPKGINCIIINTFLGEAINSVDDDIIDFLHEYKYDTAIREVSLQIEVKLRQVSGLSASGQKLVEKCFGVNGVLVPRELPNPSRQTIRNAFHSYFKFVRNEYHHELPSVDMITACMLMRRSIELLNIISAIVQKLNTEK